MINPYEMITKSALPALRAMVSRRLREDYKMTQQEVARRMGVTQASISNYSRKARGVMLNLETDPKIASAADSMASLLAKEEPDAMGALNIMTEVCDYIRFNYLLCNLHGSLDPGFQVKGCSACQGILPGRNLLDIKTTVR